MFFLVRFVLLSSFSIMGLLISRPVIAQTSGKSPIIFSEEGRLIFAQTSPNNLPQSPDIPRQQLPQTPPPETPKTPPQKPPIESPPKEASEETPVCKDTPALQPTQQQDAITQDSDTRIVMKFKFEGNTETVISDRELEELFKSCLNKPLSFAELLRARTAVTELYTKKGYITTGAYISSAQTVFGNYAEVTIKIVEGSVQEIRVNGMRRLNTNYVRERLLLGTSTPLNGNKLLNALRLLQINPLIQNISAELRAGVSPGTNILEVQVQEADTLSNQIVLNNQRSPSIGSFSRGTGLTEANLLGLGDALSINYNNTDGSNSFDFSYSLPINARNGTLSVAYGTSSSDLIERPFNELNIDSESRYYQVNLRQPIVLTPTQELAVGLIASRTETETYLGGKAFPVVLPGPDEQGRTRISAIRFYQEWIKQSRSQVFSVRSQFSFGVGAFDATINEKAPDSRFFTWRGQFQWVRSFGSSTSSLPTNPTLLFRTDVQLADRTLLPTEQLGLGGSESIRGYRQDALLTDSGILASAELRLPVAIIPEWKSVVQVIPFIDFGTGWNQGDTKDPNPSTLVSAGLGLQFIQSRNFRARLDWGIPLVNLNSTKRTWQENGIYFSVEYNPF